MAQYETNLMAEIMHNYGTEISYDIRTNDA